GRQLPLPERVARLHLTDCAPPCWIGIVLGQTTVKEAQGHISAIYGSSVRYSEEMPVRTVKVFFDGGPGGLEQVLVDFTIERKVSDLFFQFKPQTDSLTIYELSNILGMPYALLLPNYFQRTRMYFDGAEADFWSTDRVDGRAHVDYLNLGPPPQFDSSSIGRLGGWCGFRQTMHYWLSPQMDC